MFDIDGSEILDINVCVCGGGGGRYVCEQGYYDPDQGVQAGLFIQWAVGKAPVEGQQW